MLCGLLLFKYCILNYLVISVILNYSFVFGQWALFIPYKRLDSKFQTAGFGAFAGRPFKKHDIVMRSGTLFLPNNLPPHLSTWNYVFEHNETHEALPLGYGALLNHHDSSNTRIILVRKNKMFFKVRASTCIHKYTHNICISHANIHTYKHYTHKIPVQVHTYR